MLKKGIGKKLIYILLISCVVTWLIAAKMPMETVYDTITLTATKESNPAAEGNEVWIQNITVDGKKLNLEENVKQTEGKWLLENSRIGWRSYNAPDIITNTVTLQIPVGQSRQIQFQSNRWRGHVMLTQGESRQDYDLYNSSESSYLVKLNPSDCDLLSSQSQRNILPISSTFLISFLFVGTVCFLYTRFCRKEYIMKNRDEILYGLVAIAALFFMIHYGGFASLWNDEIAQIHMSYPTQTLSEVFRYNLSFVDNTPPLFAILAYFWISLVPFGEEWLRLMPQIFISFGIFLLGFGVKRHCNALAGYIASGLSATSVFLIVSIGKEYRAYGLFFMVSVLLYVCYFDRLRDNFNNRSLVKYAIAMTLVVYTHYYGVILCLSIFLYDILLFIKKQIPARVLFSYILTGMLYLPWVIAFLIYPHLKLTTWPPTPGMMDIYLLLCTLCTNKILLGVFIAVCTATAYRLLVSKFSGKTLLSIRCTLLFVCAATILISFIYSRNIAITGSIFYQRYFICLLPAVLWVLSEFIADLVDSFGQQSRKPAVVILAIFCCVFAIDLFTGAQQNKAGYAQPYREVSEFLYNNTSAMKDDTVIVYSGRYVNGLKYYLTGKNFEQEVNILGTDQINAEKIAPYRKIYLVNLHVPFPQCGFDLIESQFTKTNEWPDLHLTEYTKK